jgi:hypothetical protein
MSEAEVARNITSWKNEASHQAIRAVEQAEELTGETEELTAEAVQAAGDAMTRTAEEQREAMTDAAEQFGEASRTFAHGNAENMHRLLTFAGTAHGGLHDLQECLTGLVEGVVRTNLRLAQEMFLVESPRAFAELQQRFLREYFDAFEKGAAALIRATAKETVTL